MKKSEEAMERQGELFQHNPYMDPAAMQRVAMSSSTGYAREDDPEVRGLWLRTTKNRVRSWVLSYQIRGRPRAFTIGRAGAWSLPQVREEARRLWRLIDQGGDPLGDRQATRKAEKKPRLSHGGLHPGYSRVRPSFIRSRGAAGGLLERWIAKWVDEKGKLHTYQHADRDRVQRRLDQELALLRKHPIVRSYKPRPRRPKPSPVPMAPPVMADLNPEVLRRLDEIQRTQQAQNERLGHLQQHERNERESVQPILRRLTEIERHLRLTETPQAPRTSRRHPMGA